MAMTDRIKSTLMLLALLLVAPVPAMAEDGAAPDPDGKTWTVNIRNADIQAFITQVAEMTGKNFVVDPRVRSRDVTVISSKPLSAAEVYELFLSVLQVHGYAAVPAGDVIKIINNANAKQSNLPLSESKGEKGENLITRVISVEGAPVDELVPVLRPMVPQYGHLAAVSSANVLIISDHADNIRRIEAIITHLEGSESQDVEILQLEHAWAGDLVTLLESLVPEKAGRRGKEAPSSVTLVADERTNRLIVKGDRLARDRIRNLVIELDVPSNHAGSLQVIRLDHADAKSTAELLRSFAEGGKGGGGGGEGQSTPASGVSIQADESLNALIIRAEPALMKEMKSVISQLDVRRAQVLIEAAIVEISSGDGRALGFQYASGDEENGVGAINFSNVGVSVGEILGAVVADDASAVQLGDGITAGGGERGSDGELKWGVLIQALASTTNANLLSTPSILTLDNQEASIIVGENVPFVTGQSTSTGAGVSNPFTTIQRQDVGLTLKVTPHLAGLDTIRLELEQETSSVKDSNASTDTQQPVDIVTTKRQIQTTVLADDGETIVLGGLIKDDVREVVRKVPLLGDIPLLGILFRSKGTSREKQNLVVFLRPSILRDSQRLLDLTRNRYLGVTALQFEVNRRGDLERVVKAPLPINPDDVFSGRDGEQGEELAPAVDAYLEEQGEQPYTRSTQARQSDADEPGQPEDADTAGSESRADTDAQSADAEPGTVED
jgi:general secretion pathway protein D